MLVTGAAKVGKAGVATIVYKWGQQFDTDVVIYDYLMQSGLPDAIYQEKILAKGGRMYVPASKLNTLGTIGWIEKIIRGNGYETIHINTDSAYVAAAYIYAAKKAGIKRILVHSHCTQIDDPDKLKRTVKTLLHKACMPYVKNNTDMFLACSKAAGKWMFGEKSIKSPKYKMIYNGVEVEPYLYNEETRHRLRHELSIQGKYVIANIGRFSYQKNQEFLIEVFEKFHKRCEDSVLILVGTGELKVALEKKISESHLDGSAILLGLRNDVPQLLSAFDVLVMPSRFEGLPVTMVEAQMSELPCVVAGTITREADFTHNVVYMDGWNAEDWVETIHGLKDQKRGLNKKSKMQSHFNIKNAAKELEEILAS